MERGIDIVADGEQSKPGFFAYVRERLSGFEPRPNMTVRAPPRTASARRTVTRSIRYVSKGT